MKKALLALTVIAVLYVPVPAMGATNYWDTNVDAGAGGTGTSTPTGTWDTGTTANWNINSDGTGVPTMWAAGDSAVFSAGSDATGAYDVTVSGIQTLGPLLQIEEGAVHLVGGQVNFGATNGNITVDGTSILTISAAGSTTINGTNGITKNGTGTLVLSNGNTAQPFSKATGAILTINSGVVEFSSTGSTTGNDNALGQAPAAAQAAAITINGGTLRWNGTAAATLSVNRGITIGANGGTIDVAPTTNSGLSLPSAAAFTLNGSGTLTKAGGGRFTLNTTSNSFTGKYIVKAGSISWPGDGRFGLVPAAPVADYFTLDGGGLRDALTGSQTLNANRGITLGAAGGYLAAPSPGTVIFNGIIAGTLGGAFTAASNDGFGTFNGGIVQLGGANTYDGATQIAASTTLKLGASGVIPDTSVVTTLGSSAIFDLNGFDETVKSISGTAGTIALGTKKLTLSNPNGESYSSVLTGTAGAQLIKNGSGAISLSGSSTGFSGEVVLNNGTLGIGAANALGSNAAGPALQINGGKISNTGSGGRNMSANLKVNINADFTADDSLAGGNAGQITFQGVSTLAGGDKTITVNGTANVGFDDLRETVAGTKLTKDGTGTLALTGTNTASAFTGSVEVKAGRLQVSGTSIIGTGNNTVKLNGGALNSSASRTISSNPITNPVNVVADSAITTTSAAGTVNMAFTSNSIAGSAGTTLTFRNDGADGAGDTFKPRLSGSGFDYQGNVKVDNGATGKTQLEFANTGATIQTFSGDISGSGSLYRTSGNVGSGNGGTTELKGNNTYTGGTTIDEGTLLANNTTGSATGTGDVNVQGGKLGGTGTIGGNVIVTGGKLAPGASINSLAIGGDLSMSGGSFDYEINSTSVTADLLTVAGKLNITGAVALSATDLGGSLLAMGTKFTLINYGDTWNGGTFTGLSNYSTTLTIGSNRFAIRYDDPSGGSNFTGDLLSGGKFVTITAVPEATSFITVGLGGLFAIAAVWMSKRMGVNVLKA